jgi:flavin-dependent dehydrogenase
VTQLAGDLAQGFALQLREAGSESELWARSVIAAHGKRSNLDRVLARPFLDRRTPYLALKAHFHGPRLPGRIELHIFPGGYCGLSEIEGGQANLGLLVREEAFRAAGGSGPFAVDHFIAWLGGQDQRLAGWLGQATRLDKRWLSIAQVSFQPKEPVVGDVLMTGDAAGLIAPLAGDGIAMALRGGELAAGFVLRYLDGRLSAAALRRDYAASWQQEFVPRLRLGRWLQALLLQPQLAGLALRLLTGAPGLGRTLVLKTRDLGLMDRVRRDLGENRT